MRVWPCLLLASVAYASGPVAVKLTVCVIDGAAITLDGNLISPHEDLSAFGGKKVELDGDLYPGDVFKSKVAPRAIGTCTADEKLKLLPALARFYDEAKTVPVLAAKPRPPRATIDCDAKPSDACYELVRVPKAGGKPVVLRRARDATLIGHVFVDATYLYWSEGTIGDWKMLRQPKTGGAISTVAKGSLRGPLVRAPEGFYGVVDEGLVALPDQKAPQLLAPKWSALDVAYAGGALYWTESGPAGSSIIKTQHVPGGTPAVLAMNQPNATVPAIANGTLYWSNINVPPAGGAQIVGMPLDGGVPQVLVPTSHALFPWALAVDASWLYWTQWSVGAVGYSLFRAPATGGDAQLLGVAPTLAMNRDNRDHIALDATNVYWNARQSVARVAKTGGDVEELVRLARGDVMMFAMDDTDVYLAVVIFGS
jgi:hypothetical protein